MPAMTAREFVDMIAVPTVEEFMAEPTQRRGYLACLAVYHVSDYLKPTSAWQPVEVRKRMEAELGRPFVALWHTADAVKHREKTGKAGAVLMQSGSDISRPATGFNAGILGGDMNPGDGRPGNVLRLDDKGGRYIESDGQFYDMLDLCLIVLRGFAKLYPTELAGSLIESIRYNTASYAR